MRRLQDSVTPISINLYGPMEEEINTSCKAEVLLYSLQVSGRA